MKSLYWLPAASAATAALISGCSSSTAIPSGGGSGSVGGHGATTVSVRQVAGDRVLVNGEGRTLYLSDQEKSGKVLCASSACEAVWIPFTVGKGQPTAPAAVVSALSVVKRPDGSRQVAFNGAPLYLFSFDHSAGDVKGNGQQDSFDGTNFTWHAATASGKVGGGSVSSPAGPYGGY